MSRLVQILIKQCNKSKVLEAIRQKEGPVSYGKLLKDKNLKIKSRSTLSRHLQALVEEGALKKERGVYWINKKCEFEKEDSCNDLEKLERAREKKNRIEIVSNLKKKYIEGDYGNIDRGL